MQIEKILRWIIIGGTFAVPFIVFIVADSMFFPYIVGKNFTFRILVEIMFVAWVALAMLNEEYRPRMSVVSVSVTVFVGIVALADIFGANPLKSIWSNFERMEGLVTLLHLLAYTVVVASIFQTERIVLWFWRMELAVATLVSINAVIQFLDTGKNRLDSTLGNPIYLAVYALFNIFIVLILLARRNSAKWERISYSLILPLLFWVLFMTASRGAILGVIGGLLLAAIGILFTMRKKERFVQIFAGAIISIIILGSSGFWMIRDSSFVQNNSTLARFAGISLTEGTVFARTIVWGMAWEGVKERPILGWGQENFNLVFNKYYDPRMYAQEQWFDRTHNVVFDWLIAAGILGLLAYISIFLALLWVIYKTENFTNVQKWFLVGLLAAYSFHNLTVFDQIISYMLFFAVIAWVVATADDVSGRTLWFFKRTFRASWMVIVSALLVAAVLIIAVNWKPIQANKLLLGGLQSAGWAAAVGEKGDTAKAREFSRKSLEQLVSAAAMRTYGTQEVHEQLSQTTKRLSGASWMSEEMKKEWIKAAEDGLFFEEKRAKGDARFPVFLGSLYSTLGELEKMQEVLLRAEKISPRKQTILIELASNAVRRGDEKSAVAYLKRAYELDKEYQTAGIFYAVRLLSNNKIELFKSTFADSTYVGSDPGLLALLINSGEHKLAMQIWESAFRESLNPKTAFLLASLYQQAGDTTRIVSSIKRVIEIDERFRDEGERALKIFERLK